MLNDKKIDKNTPVPLYFQLEQIILQEINNGNYPVGSAIPTEKELSQIFDISRTTVRQAIADLVRQEKLYRVKSKGTFVSKPKINQTFTQAISSFNEDMECMGHVPATEVLQMKVIEMDEALAARFSKPEKTKAIYLYRKRMADGEPLVRVKTYLLYDLCSFVLKHDLNKESLYHVLSEDKDATVVHVIRECEVRLADEDDIKILGVEKGSPIHYFESQGYNHDEELIEYSIARYRGDRNTFRIELFNRDGE